MRSGTDRSEDALDGAQVILWALEQGLVVQLHQRLYNIGVEDGWKPTAALANRTASPDATARVPKLITVVRPPLE